MQTILTYLRALKPWQAVFSVGVLIATSSGTYAAYAAVVAPQESTITTNQVLVPVQRGDLIKQVSTSGALTYPERTVVRPKASGTIAEVKVEVGDRVDAGAVLAIVDEATRFNLQQAIPAAELAVKKAEDALAAAKKPLSLEVAQKEAALANARVALKAAQDALALARAPYTAQQIAKQEEAVASARLALQDAMDTLAEAKAGAGADDIRRQEAAVANAEAQVTAAQDALALARAPYTAQQQQKQVEAVAAARLALQTATDALAAAQASQAVTDADLALGHARETLRIAEANLPVVESVHRRIIAPLETALTDRKTAYRQAIFSLYPLIPVGVILEEHIYLSPKEILAIYLPNESAKYDVVETAWVNAVAARDARDQALLNQANAIMAAKKAIESARGSVLAAEQSLAAKKASASLDLDLRKAQVRTSDVNLTVAIEVLTTMQAGADPVQVAARQVQVDTAEVALATAREKLAQMKAGPVVLEVDVRAAQVATGEATLAAAQDSLALMRAGGDALTVQAKVAAVRLAEETLSQAESDLAEARKGVGAADLGVLEANVATARFNLDTAKDRSANADIRAPIAGTVTAVGLASGQNASTTTAAFEIADTTALELVGSIQEVDVLSVREGSAATVTLDALPGEALQGRVVSIATTGNSSQGVVTYPVRISLEAAGGVVLRDGLSATATIVVEKQENVLLVPVQALVGTFDQPQIRVLQAGTPVVRPVSLGNTDGYWVAVLSGLAEGDRVVMDSLRATTSGQLGVRPGQALGGLGGGTFTVNTGPGAGGRGQTGGGGNR